MQLAQQILNGLALGGIYALIAIGFSLVYGILKIVNFAHGDVYMAGTFVAFWLTMQEGWNFFPAAAAGIAAGALLGIVVERVASRPVRNHPRLIAMISTYALALIIRNIVESRSGAANSAFNVPGSGKTLTIASVRLPLIAIIAVLVAAVTVVLLGIYLRKTRSGFAIRATAQDFTTASLMGINTNRIVILVFAIGSAIGVIGGLMYCGLIGVFYVGMGFDGLLKGFAAAVVGGIGDLRGAMVGGLLIGLSEGLLAPYISTGFGDAISYGLLIAVLLVKPDGIFGRKLEARV